MTATGSPTALPLREPGGQLVARFTVNGEPVPKERPRVVHQDGRTRTYTPDRTEQAEARIGWAFRRAAPTHRPDDETAYGMTVCFYAGSHQRRDVDNLIKTVLDGLNKVAWSDDHQVVEVTARKTVEVDQARTEIAVYRLGPLPQPARGGVCESCGGPTSKKTVRRCRACRTGRTPQPAGGEAGGGVGRLA